jgi:hypothetical protein
MDTFFNKSNNSNIIYENLINSNAIFIIFEYGKDTKY